MLSLYKLYCWNFTIIFFRKTKIKNNVGKHRYSVSTKITMINKTCSENVALCNGMLLYAFFFIFFFICRFYFIVMFHLNHLFSRKHVAESIAYASIAIPRIQINSESEWNTHTSSIYKCPSEARLLARAVIWPIHVPVIKGD